MSVFRFFSLLAVAALATGCMTIPTIRTITGAGRQTTRRYDLAGFTKLNISSAFTADVARAAGYKVEVTVDDNLLDHLAVRVSGDTLYIGLAPGIVIQGAAKMAAVTLPELTGLDLSGATRATVSGFSSDKGLSVTVTGASRLSGDIACGDVRFDVSGASLVELSGSARGLRANVSGASTLALEDFPAADVSVEVSGASRATVNVRGTLDASASGGSTILYIGDPASVRAHTSGASTVRPR